MEPKEMKRITLCSVILWTLSVMAAEAQVCSPGHRQEGGGSLDIVVPTCMPPAVTPCEQITSRIVTPERMCRPPVAPAKLVTRLRPMPCEPLERGPLYQGIITPKNGRSFPEESL